jgi:hypothetical protein
MTLSGAVLAFVVKEKLDEKIKASGCEWCFALACLGLSVLVAIVANITRAFDFRYTRRAVRERMNEGTNHHELHDKAESLGAWTWGLFCCQAASFALGIFLLALSLRPFICWSR